jgi:formylglycine-generating enzyme required for sulfatase activity
MRREHLLFALATALAVVACKRKPSRVELGGSSIGAYLPVAGGTFAMGSRTDDSDERPVHTEKVATFEMQRTLVTVGQYRACEAAGACTPTVDKPFCNEHIAGRDAHPMNCATWAQAKAYCAWDGARLPSEAEWEYAARGTDGRRYPWGNEAPAKQLCWDGKTSDLGMMKRRCTCGVAEHPSGASPFGMLDMAGNVWEWTSDLGSEDYDAPRAGPKRIVRGGTWYSFDARDVRATLRFREREGIEDYGTGFRCAR